MPFGAQVQAEGETRFALWAPGARQVELLLDHGAGTATAHPMTGHADGWYERVANAPDGTQYRYRIDGTLDVPDPASRFNPADVNGPSAVIDAARFRWTDDSWSGRPWHAAVIYELHVGTFTPAGTFAGVEARLDYLAALGVTAIELMPIADFPGTRNWGYDGVLPFAPDAAYGTPDDLKRLIDAAHARQLMVLLDVVYNHFGPEGNYLGAYAPEFFSTRHRSPWGDGLNFDGPGSATVRAFFIHNALYWLEEFHFDGLRLDAAHAINDDSTDHFLDELAATVRKALPARHIHLVLENEANEAARLACDPHGQRRFDAQWNDDIHHALHVIATGETRGYYADSAADPVGRLGVALAEGFVDQGGVSAYHGAARGSNSRGLPPHAFVSFLQNHDQVGNRPYGDRLAAQISLPMLQALTTVMLLAPPPPLLFMGDEFAAATPFLFFCDFPEPLASSVRAGRAREFAAFVHTDARPLPDATALATFASSKLDWASLDAPVHAAMLAFTRSLLALRHAEIVPLLPAMTGHAGSWQRLGERGLRVAWRSGSATLWMTANLGDVPLAVATSAGRCLHATAGADAAGTLAPWSVVVTLAADGASDDR